MHDFKNNYCSDAIIFGRHWLFVFVSVLLLLSGSNRASAQPGEPVSADPAANKKTAIADKWAVVIGVSQFKDKEIKCSTGSADARKFAAFLTTKGNFAADHVKVLVDADATRDNVMFALGGNWLPRVANPDDLILVYFRTAGSPPKMDLDGVSYFLASDSELKALYATGIPMDFLARLLKDRTHCRQQVLIADCDYSAAIMQQSGSQFRSGREGPTIESVLVSACGKDEHSSEEKSAGGSIFTKRLLEAMQSKGDATDFLSEFAMLAKNVESDARKEWGLMQTPEMHSTAKEALLLLAKPAAPRPAAAPEGK